MFVDLDDARNGPAVQDLWMLLNGDKAEQRMQLETIIEAYEEFSEFDTAEIGLIEPLRAMRCCTGCWSGFAQTVTSAFHCPSRKPTMP